MSRSLRWACDGSRRPSNESGYFFGEVGGPVSWAQYEPSPRTLPEGDEVDIGHLEPIYMYLSFFLSAGHRGRVSTLRHLARPTTHCCYGVVGIGVPKKKQKQRGRHRAFSSEPPTPYTKQNTTPASSRAPRHPYHHDEGSQPVLTRCSPRALARASVHIRKALGGGNAAG